MPSVMASATLYRHRAVPPASYLAARLAPVCVSRAPISQHGPYPLGDEDAKLL